MKNLTKWCVIIIILISPFIATIIPWGIKHALGSELSCNALLGGKDKLAIKFYISCEAGMAGIDDAKAVYIANKESSLNPKAYNSKTHDRGLWQINKKYHSEVSDACAYSIICSTKWSIQKLKEGQENIWVAWNKTLAKK